MRGAKKNIKLLLNFQPNLVIITSLVKKSTVFKGRACLGLSPLLIYYGK
jgi:hypothetical protein